MLWLAGLMGMMVLGSVAVLGTQGSDDNPEDAPVGGDEIMDHIAAHAQTLHGAVPTGQEPHRGPELLGFAAPLDAAPVEETLADGTMPRWSGSFFETGPDAAPDVPDAWSDAEPQPEGFDPQNERMVIVWDDSGGAQPPLLGLCMSQTPGMTDILLDGAPIATLAEADVPPLASIVLIGESAAAGLAG